MKTPEELHREFDEAFRNIMGLETDPEGTPDMYLIRRGDTPETSVITDGISFNDEKEEIKVFYDDQRITDLKETEKAIEQKFNEWESVTDIDNPISVADMKKDILTHLRSDLTKLEEGI